MKIVAEDVRAVSAMLRPPSRAAPARAPAPVSRLRRLDGGRIRVMKASLSSIVGDQIDVGPGPDGRVDHDRLDPPCGLETEKPAVRKRLGDHAKIFKVEVVREAAARDPGDGIVHVIALDPRGLAELQGAAIGARA
ncbi:hypothetical protein D3C72_1931790 [compost metagenome]